MKSLCRVLIALMIWTPYQVATAGMIGTEQLSVSTLQADRAVTLALIARADVARALQALGVDPQNARERIAALSDEEARALAGRVAAAPAGADAGGIVFVILLLLGLWWFWER